MIKINKLSLSAGEGMTKDQKDQLAANTTDISTLKENQTTVDDIKEIMASGLSDIETNLGDVTTLETTAKTSAVAAINELADKVAEMYEDYINADALI